MRAQAQRRSARPYLGVSSAAARPLGALELRSVPVELIVAALLATVVLPFGIGYWIGHGALAAAPFAALGATVLIRQAEIAAEEPTPAGLLVWIVISAALSAAAAFGGGRLRERHRNPRA
jgi:hypothetical protein